MAKTRTKLEDFIELHDDVAKAEQRLQTLDQNPNDKDVHDDVIDYAMKYTGQNIVTLDNEGKMVEPTPEVKRAVLEAWHDSALDTVLDFGAVHLEDILKEVDLKKFDQVLLNTIPYKEDGYQDVAKLHKEYLELYNIAAKYHQASEQGSSGQKVAALQAMRKRTPEALKERIKAHNKKRQKSDFKDVLDESGIERWADALAYVGMVNPSFAVQAFEQSVKAKYDAIVSALGGESGVKEYVRRSTEDMNKQFRIAKANESEESKKMKEATEHDERQEHSDKKDKYKAERKKYEKGRERFYGGLHQIARAA